VSGPGSLYTNVEYINVFGFSNAPAALVVESGGVVAAESVDLFSYATLTGRGGIVVSDVNNVAGVVAPGSALGELTIAGDYEQSADGTLQIQLGGATAITEYDRLIVTGDATLAGMLDVTLLNGFAPTPSQSFDILNWGSRAGEFSSVTLPPLAQGLFWDRSRLYSDGILSIVTAPPGDFNADGAVNAADYVVWRKNPGGIYGPNDYTIWRSHFGEPAGGSSVNSVSEAVPEPATLVLLMFAAVSWSTQRRRRV
jgi:hypothetical protein